ncbi:MAG TPA: NUDIX hydrolase [Amycolatopsis sp.]|nr:NUDIX hydrolase [Amycolatopsis sp.]
MDLLPFDEYVRSLDRKRMSAGALFRDGDDRVLLVEPSYKAQWDIPGGAVDAGEAPWAAARREVREELGLDRVFSRLLVIDHVHDDGPLPEGIAFIFDGGSITAREVDAFDITDPEIISVALLPLNDAASLLKPSLTARLTAALRACHTGELALCDNGAPVT